MVGPGTAGGRAAEAESRRSTYAIAQAFSLTLVTCGMLPSCGEAPLELNASQSAIMGGEESGAELNAVVRVVGTAATGGTTCTGTLIGARLVLTALHCVAELDEGGGFACTVDGTLNQDVGTGGYLGATFAPSDVHVFVGAEPSLVPAAGVERIIAPFTNLICQNDIAVLLLDTDLTLAPIPLRLDTPTNVGESMTMVGYGINEFNSLTRRQRSGEPVLAVGPSDINPTQSGSAPRTFTMGAGACKGDSGGPALSDETGAAVGVFSIVGEGCGLATAATTYTQIAPFREMIREVFDSIGQQPLVEENPDNQAPTNTGSGCQLRPANSAPPSVPLLLAASVILAIRRIRQHFARFAIC